MFSSKWGPTMDGLPGDGNGAYQTTPLDKTRKATVHARQVPQNPSPGAPPGPVQSPLLFGTSVVTGFTVGSKLPLTAEPTEWRVNATVPRGVRSEPRSITSSGTVVVKSGSGDGKTTTLDVVSTVFYPVFVPAEEKRVSVYITENSGKLDALQTHVDQIRTGATSCLLLALASAKTAIKSAASGHSLVPLREAFADGIRGMWEGCIGAALEAHITDVNSGGSGVVGPAMAFSAWCETETATATTRILNSSVGADESGDVPASAEADVFDVLVTLGCRARNASGGMSVVHQSIWAVLSTLRPSAYYAQAMLVLAACEMVANTPDVVLGPGIEEGDIKPRGSGFVPFATYEALMGPLFRGYGPVAAAVWSQNTEPVMAEDSDSIQFCVWTKEMYAAQWSDSVAGCSTNRHPSYDVFVETSNRLRKLVSPRPAATVAKPGVNAGVGATPPLADDDDSAAAVTNPSPTKRVRLKE